MMMTYQEGSKRHALLSAMVTWVTALSTIPYIFYSKWTSCLTFLSEFRDDTCKYHEFVIRYFDLNFTGFVDVK
jgi:hypothetical protein